MNRRALLEEVAAGRLAPVEAARLLDAPAPRAVAVRLRSAYQAVDVVADPLVADVLVVGGTHRVAREGDVCVVTDTIAEGGRFGSWHGGGRLALRANPALDIDAEVIGAVLSIYGMHGAVRAAVQAGSARIERATGALDLRVTAGAAAVTGAPRDGDWRVRCESGTLELILDRDADVTVTVEQRHSRVDALGLRDRAVLGAGTHAIAVEVAYSDVAVRTP